MNQRTYRTRAVVLRRINLGETDRVLTIFSRDRGKLSAIAKGSRRIKSSLSGSTELCSCSTFQLAVGQTLDVVTQAELKSAFLGLRRDLDRIARALYVLEFCSEFLEERQPQPELFDLLISALYSLEQAEALDQVVTGFEAQAMALLGYEPQMQVCVDCGQPPGSGSVRFSPGLGGVICWRCADRHRDSMRLSADALAEMKRMTRAQLPVLGIPGPSSPILGEVRRAVRAHVRQRAEREMKSSRFIEQLRTEGSLRNEVEDETGREA